MVEVTGVWLRGGENEVTVLVEVAGKWHEVITEYMPTSGNDGAVWPISHIAEEGALAEVGDGLCDACAGRGVVDENGNPSVWGRTDSRECAQCDGMGTLAADGEERA